VGLARSLRRRLGHYRSIDDYEYLRRLARGGSVDPSDEGHGASPVLRIAEPDLGIVFVLDDWRDAPQKLLVRHGYARYGGVVAAIRAFARPETSVLDIGANVGAIALYASRVVPSARVHAFEPSPRTAPLLRRNVALNRAANVEIHEVGLGREEGTFDFHMETAASTNSGLSSFRAASRHKSAEVVRVAMTTLDRLAPRLGAASFVKLDTQGTELEVLEGGREWLRRERPAIVLEHEDDHFDDPAAARERMRSLLASLGYRAFVFSRKDPLLLLDVNWSRPIRGDLLALAGV